MDEAKALTIATDALWIANTEADQPVYEKLPVADLNAYLNQTDISITYLLNHRQLSQSDIALVPASGETEAVDDDGDAADDPAFWLHPEYVSKSLILGTNKQGGLMAYRLDGTQVQYLNEGEPNNIDIRNNILNWDNTPFSLAAVSNRELNTIALYEIREATDTQDPIQPLMAVGNAVHEEAPELVSNVNEVYGLCMYAVDGIAYVFVNGKDGQVEQWQLTPTQEGMNGEIVRTFSVPGQPEGCVADDSSDTLYLGEEDYGIWQFEAQPNAGTAAVEFARVDGQTLVADIEGLTLYDNGAEKYLIASSQGSNRSQRKANL